ncbi:hypothetical protein DFH07DRAFT_964663 [Mycena maculata]|uniref:DUF6535 domain-containing protein n=1 Tax=Mycena maculata TaxID=230809 RepID=A0AAD7N236_9AGAR|nr:hypothetical protein DFH07DRAFT_964663 [Mycena maculata]
MPRLTPQVDKWLLRLRRAVDALKPKAANTDQKTVFWDAYKSLADEHDKEFQQRYSMDLDTSLIFAGLFSAVDSAFVIQIQQEIQPHNTLPIIVVAQSLLYISLGSTLLAALLAVFGKQWLMYYSAAEERGTMETRGLERQRKLDGLRKWRFNTLMQMFPFLLQLGLLLFATGLSVYLWTVHLSLAIIVLSFTSFAVGSYVCLLISTVISPESPFQTPLTPFVARLLPTTLWMGLKDSLSRAATHRSGRFVQRTPLACPPWIQASPGILPDISPEATWLPRELDSFKMFTAEFPQPSPEVPAVSWVLETSTDPYMVTIAAEMAVTLQWPSTMDLRPQLTRLRDSILGCFDCTPLGNSIFRLNGIRDGMSRRATHLGRAYCALRCVHQSLEADHDLIPKISSLRFVGLDPELANVLQILEVKPDVYVSSDAPLAAKWALHVIPVACRRYEDSEAKLRALEYFLHQFDGEIPNLDPSSFADYLFCVNSFLSATRDRDMVWMDKG